jgi:hypothetical protein
VDATLAEAAETLNIIVFFKDFRFSKSTAVRGYAKHDAAVSACLELCDPSAAAQAFFWVKPLARCPEIARALGGKILIVCSDCARVLPGEKLGIER